MLYRYNHPQTTLKSVEILSGTKSPEALIYAPEGTSADALLSIRHRLEGRGYLTLPDAIDGQQVLRVEKLGTRDHFLADLVASGLVQGPPQMIATPRDKALHRSFKEVAGDNTKTAAGWLFTVGDGLLVGSGLMRHDPHEAAAGALWGLTGLVLAFYGKKDPNTELGLLYRKLDEHLKREGIEFPKDERELIDAMKRKDGIVQHVNEFFTNNAADFHHVVQTIGGIKLAQAGKAQGNGYKHAAGYTVAFGQAMGLLPEKKKPGAATDAVDSHAMNAFAPTGDDEDEEKKKHAELAAGHGGVLPQEPDHRNPLRRTFDWFAEKPLRFSGLFPFANNVLNVAGAFAIERPRVREIDPRPGDPVRKGPPPAPFAEHLKQADNQIGSAQEKLNVWRAEREKTGITVLPGNEEYKALQAGVTEAQKARQKLLDIEKSTITSPFHIPGIGRDIRAYHVNLATAACYMVANLLYAVSPKNTPCDLTRSGGLDELYAVAANVVTSQPKEHREAVVHQLATTFAAMPDIDKSTAEIARALNAKIALIEKSPWAERVTKPAAPAITGAALA